MKSLVGFGKNIINVTSQFEQTQKALETVTQSAEKGKKLFEDLRKFSFDTTFGVDELANASQQLLNVGVSTSALKKDLKMLGDLAQGDKMKFQELTSIFAKVQSTGKASSMQLQQFALRGIPIIQTLKDMGVTGTASAEQLTEAFEKLTAEGGQFHDAMNNIIDTIEGKQGFITDTLKEIAVNFGEVTGITDTYKETLDAVYSVLDWVNNGLRALNENPVMKAIISGVLTTALTALVAIVGVSLVSALKAVAIQLGIIAGLKTLISPVGAVAGIVAVLGGLIAVKKSFDNSTEKTAENVERFAKAAEDAKKAMQEANNLRSVGVVTEGDTKKARLSSEQQYLAGLREGSKNRQNKILELQAQLEDLDMGIDGWEFEETKALKEQIAYYQSIDEYVKGIIKDQERLVKTLEDEEAKYIKLSDSAEDFLGIKDQTLTKDEKELKSLEEQIKWLQDYKKQWEELDNTYDMDGGLIKFDDKTRKEIDDTTAYFQKKLDDLKLDLEIANMDEWKKDLMNLYGFDKDTVKGLKDSAGNKWVEAGLNARLSQRELEKNTYAQLGMNQSKDAQKNAGIAYAKQLVADIKKLTETGRFGAVGKNGELDNTTKAYLESLNKCKEELDAMGVTQEQWDEILGNSVEELKKTSFSDVIEEWKKSSNVGTMAGGYAMDALSSYSGDLSAGIQGFQNGGIWGAIISVLVNAIAKVASECEGFAEVMNPVTTAMEQLKPFIQWLINKLARYTRHLEAMFNVVAKLFDALEPLIDILIDGLLEPLNLSLSILGYLLNEITPLISMVADGLAWFLKVITFGVLDVMKEINDDFANTRKIVEDENDARKKELEQLRALQAEYGRMLDAMQENEEWYLRQKTSLNANSRKDSYSVNDMILTPQGQFSTHPDDYIIATKNPQSLGSGAVVNVNIENNASDAVEVSATPVNRNGMQEIMIQISRKIADDVANGANGWDMAMARQSVRQAGRSLSF